MELAMHCRDSGDRLSVRASYGSEWTVGVRHLFLVVAFPVSVRQQVLEPSDTPRKKVAGFSVIACDVPARIRQRCRSTCPHGLASVASVWRDYSGLHAVRLNCIKLSEARMYTMCLGCWRSYGFMRPVLKHGPRSLTCVRVLG